ncbi:hypothetical protein AX16_009437 [Volvariella volvacea WC 439]|nr:hypothetical protein AX16_009437 [Volvariella volvacea WC 439]
MNIKSLYSNAEIKGTLSQYFATAVPLTVLTIWIVVASQRGSPGGDLASQSGFKRLAWPLWFAERVARDIESAVAPIASALPSRTPSQMVQVEESMGASTSGTRASSRRMRIAEMGQGQGGVVIAAVPGGGQTRDA